MLHTMWDNDLQERAPGKVFLSHTFTVHKHNSNKHRFVIALNILY